MTEVAEILLTDIDDSYALNCRGEIDPRNVTELARDIGERGLLQPIVITEADGFVLSTDGAVTHDGHGDPIRNDIKSPMGRPYVLVLGYRRFTAYKVLSKTPSFGHKWLRIPAMIKCMTSEYDRRIANLSENIQRESLNIVQEARSIASFINDGHTMRDIAARLNKSLGWVNIRQMLLNLPEAVQAEFATGILTQTQIHDIHNVLKDEGEAACLVAAREFKEQKQRGNKNARVKMKHQNTMKRIRKRPEINGLLDYFANINAMGLHTRILAWASGEISDVELQVDVRQYCDDNGILFKELVGNY